MWSKVGAALAAIDPADKCGRVEAIWRTVEEGAWAPSSPPEIGTLTCGRPARPELVEPRALPRRGLGSREGRAALVHAIAHIEFNAVNLALDAALRFSGLPGDYYRDWLSVAWDEVRHFRMLETRLGEMDYAYGDFPAHNGLWDMAEKTAHDPLVRMALVPRVLEARGLDVTPGMIERLSVVGDEETVSLLRLILEEEERHVAIGSRWFEYLCARRELDPEPTFTGLLKEYFNGQVRGPINVSARRRAGFSERELESLARMSCVR